MYTSLIADETHQNATATVHVLIVPTVLSPGFNHPVPPDKICEPFPREAIESAAYAKEVANRIAAPFYSSPYAQDADDILQGPELALELADIYATPPNSKSVRGVPLPLPALPLPNAPVPAPPFLSPASPFSLPPARPPCRTLPSHMQVPTVAQALHLRPSEPTRLQLTDPTTR